MKLVVLTLLFSSHFTCVQTSVTCPVPETITNGDVSSTGVNVNDAATYTCRNGYRLDGPSKLVCTADGTWDSNPPTCKDIDLYFNFECYVNGTITAVNPDPSSMIFAKALNEDGLCNTAFNSDSTKVTIEGCALDKVISLVFTPYSAGVPDVIKNDVKYYNITCMTLPVDGINVVVTDSTWIRNLLKTSKEPSRTPKVYLNSDLGLVNSTFENVTNPPETLTLAINEVLRWKLYVPESYIIQPINCTAYSGEVDDSGSKFSADIIQFGLDLDLVSDFEFEDENIKHTMVADVMAFRFPGSNTIEIVCSVKGCPQGSTACDFTCPDRTRRSVTNNSPTEIMASPVLDRRYFHDVENSAQDGRYSRDVGNSAYDYRYSRGDKKPIHRTTSISFRVIGPPNVGLQYLYLFENSSHTVKQCILMMTFIMMIGREVCT